MDEDGLLEAKPTIAEVLSDSGLHFFDLCSMTNAFPVSSGSLAIIAGADTTSSVLSSFLYFIMRHPKAYRRVQEEVESLGSDLARPEKQAKLAYLNAAM